MKLGAAVFNEFRGKSKKINRPLIKQVLLLQRHLLFSYFSSQPFHLADFLGMWEIGFFPPAAYMESRP